MSIETIVDRQYAIANNQAEDIGLPKYRIYAMCNLRGGIGKTTLAFNVSYLVDDLLVVDVRREICHIFMITATIQVNKQMSGICCCHIWFQGLVNLRVLLPILVQQMNIFRREIIITFRLRKNCICCLRS